MKFLDKKKVTALLQKSQQDPRIKSLLDSGLSGYDSVGLLDRVKAIEVYSIKAETGGAKFDGFADLLDNLRGLDEQKIRVHQVPFGESLVIIFTDAPMRSIIGALLPR